MGDLNWEQIEQIVDEVLDLPPEQRFSYIEKKCSHNQQLKTQVTQLVESIYDSDGWLEELKDQKVEYYSDISDDLEALESSHNFIDQDVGAYTIKEQVGEGGMGRVYLAERSDGSFEHKVAIKIIRQNQATQTNIQRFEREQRILAGLNHPAIAQLYDGGITDEGFPYIIMEYVSGIPFLDYCSKNNLSLDRKINLFKQVLEAVRYAHENLIIHRDLKPDNILVDESGNVKILDFGISKLLEDEDDLSLTRTGTRILTPKYAAPEQIKQQNITTATDLYSLGVIFYELLCEHPPFDLTDRTTYEAEQIILNQHPDKPSVKAPSRQEAQAIKGDLNAIALKAIRKEPDQRYRVATEFLDDLDHYLNDLPVSARTDSFKYRSSKFFGRHKKSISAAAVILMLIVGLSGYYTWRIAEERNQARYEAEKAEQVIEYVKEIFQANNPSENKGDTLNAADLLSNGLEKVDQLGNQPEIQSELMTVLADVYSSIGNYGKSDSLLQASLSIKQQIYGKSSPEVAQIYSYMGSLEKNMGNSKEALNYHKQAQAIYQKQDDPNPKLLAETSGDIAIAFENMGEMTKAKTMYEKALQHYDNKSLTRSDSNRVLIINRNYGTLLAKQGQFNQAETLLVNAYDIVTKFYGELTLETARAANDLGAFYMDQEEYSKAYPLFQKSLTIKKEIQGENHPKIASTYNNMAVLQERMRHFAVAESLYNKTLKLTYAVFGEKHPATVATLSNLASLNRRIGNFSKAESLYTAVLNLDKKIFGKNHHYIAADLNSIAAINHVKGNLSKSDSLFGEATSMMRKVLPEPHPDLIKTLVDHSKLLIDREKFATAEDKLKEARNKLTNNENADPKDLIEVYTLLGNCYIKQGAFNEAESILFKASNKIDSLQLKDTVLSNLVSATFDTLQANKTL